MWEWVWPTGLAPPSTCIPGSDLLFNPPYLHVCHPFKPSICRVKVLALPLTCQTVVRLGAVYQAAPVKVSLFLFWLIHIDQERWANESKRNLFIPELLCTDNGVTITATPSFPELDVAEILGPLDVSITFLHLANHLLTVPCTSLLSLWLSWSPPEALFNTFYINLWICAVNSCLSLVCLYYTPRHACSTFSRCLPGATMHPVTFLFLHFRSPEWHERWRSKLAELIPLSFIFIYTLLFWIISCVHSSSIIFLRHCWKYNWCVKSEILNYYCVHYIFRSAFKFLAFDLKVQPMVPFITIW